jgi:hypothetical protein
MRDTDKQDYIAQAERHITFVQERIARQKRIIDELAQTRQETDCAVSMLHALETCLHAFEQHREASSSGARPDGRSLTSSDHSQSASILDQPLVVFGTPRRYEADVKAVSSEQFPSLASEAWRGTCHLRYEKATRARSSA